MAEPAPVVVESPSAVVHGALCLCTLVKPHAPEGVVACFPDRCSPDVCDPRSNTAWCKMLCCESSSAGTLVDGVCRSLRSTQPSISEDSALESVVRATADTVMWKRRTDDTPPPASPAAIETSECSWIMWALVAAASDDTNRSAAVGDLSKDLSGGMGDVTVPLGADVWFAVWGERTRDIALINRLIACSLAHAHHRTTSGSIPKIERVDVINALMETLWGQPGARKSPRSVILGGTHYTHTRLPHVGNRQKAAVLEFLSGPSAPRFLGGLPLDPARISRLFQC